MKAVIDIGTNTVLALVVQLKDRELVPLYDVYELSRISSEIFDSRIIDNQVIDKVADTLNRLKKDIYAKVGKKIPISLVGTEVFRIADNQDEIIERIYKKTNLRVRVLTFKEEATYAFLGAIYYKKKIDFQITEPYLVIGIGDGNSEMIYRSVKGEIFPYSIDIGTLKLKKEYLSHDPPYTEEIRQCSEAIQRILSKKKVKFSSLKNIKCIGVAGIAVSLAWIDQQLHQFNSQKLHSYILTAKNIHQFLEIYSGHTYEELRCLQPDVLTGREDLIFSGVLLLSEIMKFYNLSEIKVSVGDIRYGMLFQEYRNFKIQ